MAPMITGTITLIGSPNVMIGALPAARAFADSATCSGMLPLFPHSPPPVPIAQGSSTVFINGFMAARKTDKLVCGAVIATGCATVIIGGETGTALAVTAEVPSWVYHTLLGLMVAGTIIGTGGAALAFGWGAALGGLGLGFLGGVGGGQIGGWAGERIGGLFGNPELGRRIGETGGGLLGSLLGGALGGRLGGKLFPKGGSPPGETPLLGEPKSTRPDPELAAAAGELQKPWLVRAGEGSRPPTARDARPGSPMELNSSESNTYLYVVKEDGTIVYAPQRQLPGGGEAVKHTDLAEGGPARVSGEIKHDPATDTWVMDDESGRYSAMPIDPDNPRSPIIGTRNQENVNAAAELARRSGSAQNIVPKEKD
jgi:uncharacterized Zn-binding protein involved in type VI secretion